MSSTWTARSSCYKNGQFRDEDFRYQNVRESLAAKLAAKDPARAEAMVEAIPDPLAKVSALTSVAKALPASERARKQALLERATTLLRDRLQQANAGRRLRLISAIAEQWLDMGERDRARLVLQDGEDFERRLPDRFSRPTGAARARSGRGAVAEATECSQVNPSYRDRALAEVAVQLATDHPAEAEQVFNLREGGR